MNDEGCPQGSARSSRRRRGAAQPRLPELTLLEPHRPKRHLRPPRASTPGKTVPPGRRRGARAVVAQQLREYTAPESER